jgi:hypothetical protein
VAHVLVLLVVLKLPWAHVPQLRSTSELPSSLTNSPGTHAERATHAVAGFASWSQLPASHSSAALSAPAQ